MSRTGVQGRYVYSWPASRGWIRSRSCEELRRTPSIQEEMEEKEEEEEAVKEDKNKEEGEDTVARVETGSPETIGECLHCSKSKDDIGLSQGSQGRSWGKDDLGLSQRSQGRSWGRMEETRSRAAGEVIRTTSRMVFPVA